MGFSGRFFLRFTAIKEGSPAAVLQELLVEKWKLEHGDKDRIVMYHRIEYNQDKALENADFVSFLLII